MATISLSLWLITAATCLTLSVSAIDPMAQFFKRKLADLNDCVQFSRQSQFLLAKCDAYHKAGTDKGEWFIDDAYTVPLLKCAAYNADRNASGLRLPAIIYEVQNVSDFRLGTILNDMVLLESNVEAYLEIVPRLTFLFGPGGKKEEMAKGFGSLVTSWMAIAPAEHEEVTSYYPQEFFDQLSLMEFTSQVANKYLVLNGWHLKNIPYVPHLEKNLLSVFSGLIVWVEVEHAYLIGRNEVTKFLNGSTTLPVWYDMPGSPEFAAAWRMEAVGRTVVLMVLGVVWVA